MTQNNQARPPETRIPADLQQYLCAIQSAVASLEHRCRLANHLDWTRHTELISTSASQLAQSAAARLDPVRRSSRATDPAISTTLSQLVGYCEQLETAMAIDPDAQRTLGLARDQLELLSELTQSG